MCISVSARPNQAPPRGRRGAAAGASRRRHRPPPETFPSRVRRTNAPPQGKRCVEGRFPRARTRSARKPTPCRGALQVMVACGDCVLPRFRWPTQPISHSRRDPASRERRRPITDLSSHRVQLRTRFDKTDDTPRTLKLDEVNRTFEQARRGPGKGMNTVAGPRRPDRMEALSTTGPWNVLRLTRGQGLPGDFAHEILS